MLLDALSCGAASSGHFAADVRSRADRDQAGIAHHYGSPVSSVI
jgi:hypothetical protein